MRPTIGRVALYTRGVGEEWPAHITRVVLFAGGDPDVENYHDVYLVVFIHGRAMNPTNRSDAIFFTPGPVRFSETPEANTWRWPPKV